MFGYWLSNVSKRCHEAQEPYFGIASSLALGIEGRAARVALWAFRGLKLHGAVVAYKAGQIPEWIGGQVSGYITKPVNKAIAGRIQATVRQRVTSANNVHAGRTYDIRADGHDQMVIVYHDADRAGRHLDIHIGKLSIVKRLPKGFPISTDDKGALTGASKDRLMDLVRKEFEGRAWLAQNLDHDVADARFSWQGRRHGPTGYGAGESRQVISDEPIYTHSTGSALEISAPHILNNRTLFVFKIMDKNNLRSVPILALGVKAPKAPALKDRLHLTFDKDPEKFLKHIGPDGDIRVKYDGASCYIERTPDGTRVWSPRVSKTSGRRIEYNSKIPGIEQLRGPRAIAMGELLYHDSEGNYLPAHEVGGILNGGRLPMAHPEIRVYRVDKFQGHKSPVSQGDNLKQINAFLRCGRRETSHIIKPCESVAYDSVLKSGHLRKLEGLVGVPAGGSLADGRKLKWRGDTADWKVKAINLKPGAAGGVAGTVEFTSLESGKSYKLGGGPLGPMQQRVDMMKHPKRYIGDVMKVNSFGGHEGRAATFDSWHLDK